MFDPDRDWSFIGSISARVYARRAPVSSKPSKLVEAHELLQLGLSLMKQAAEIPNARSAAVLFRDGLIVALLALRPLRRKNLTNLTIGIDLIMIEGRWLIVLARSQTKTHAALEFAWPEELHEPLETYLAVHRATLIARHGRWHAEVGNRLWVSSDGSPLTQMAIYDNIVRRTRKAFGRRINPHLFRDAAATSLAIHDPAACGQLHQSSEIARSRQSSDTTTRRGRWRHKEPTQSTSRTCEGGRPPRSRTAVPSAFCCDGVATVRTNCMSRSRPISQSTARRSSRHGRWHAEVGNRLRVSSDGSPLTQMAIYDNIVRRTRKAFGRGINLHLFRDAAATSLAIHGTASVRAAASILGNSSLTTIERHYNQARSKEAQKTYAEHISDLRRRPPSP